MALAHSDAAEHVRIYYDAKRTASLVILTALMLRHYGDDLDSLVTDAKKYLGIKPEETRVALHGAIALDQVIEVETGYPQGWL